MLRAARANGISPVVRCLRQDISRVLDMGAGAVQIPMVESAEKRELVQQVRYLPVDRRGSAFSPRAAGHGAFPGAAHTQRSNDGIALVAMIETPATAARGGEIAAVEGIDAVFVGPNDLSHAMGFGSDWNAPEVMQQIEMALRTVSAAGKAAGIVALTPQDEEKFAAWGARFFASVTTGIITRALQQASAAGGRLDIQARLNY